VDNLGEAVINLEVVSKNKDKLDMIKTIQKLREENSVEDVKIILEGEGGNVMGEGTVIKIDISKFKKEEDRETDLISTLERLKETVERFRDTMDSYNKENFKHITENILYVSDGFKYLGEQLLQSMCLDLERIVEKPLFHVNGLVSEEKNIEELLKKLNEVIDKLPKRTEEEAKWVQEYKNEEVKLSNKVKEKINLAIDKSEKILQVLSIVTPILVSTLGGDVGVIKEIKYYEINIEYYMENGDTTPKLEGTDDDEYKTCLKSGKGEMTGDRINIQFSRD